MLHKRESARKARITVNPCPTTTRMKRGEGEAKGKTVAGETDGGQTESESGDWGGKERRKAGRRLRSARRAGGSGPFAASVVVFAVVEEKKMKIVGGECHPSRLRLSVSRTRRLMKPLSKQTSGFPITFAHQGSIPPNRTGPGFYDTNVWTTWMDGRPC